MIRAAVTLALLFALQPVSAQSLPRSIRGYKVHEPQKRSVVVTGISDSAPAIGIPAPAVQVDQPRIIDVSPFALTFAASFSLGVMPQSGTVDFLAFHDFRVDGIPVEVEEYRHSFLIRKGEALTLPEPIRISLSTFRAAHAVGRELLDSKPVWNVAGRVFVFGRFRKMGMNFKRVVPIDVSFQLQNPVYRRPPD